MLNISGLIFQIINEVTMAQAVLNTGETLIAINDLFIGPRSHTSARYTIRIGKRTEDHSSSGIIVSTGLGSTGWLRSIVWGHWNYYRIDGTTSQRQKKRGSDIRGTLCLECRSSLFFCTGTLAQQDIFGKDYLWQNHGEKATGSCFTNAGTWCYL